MRDIFYDNLRFYEFRRRAAAVLYPNRCTFCNELIPAEEYYCEDCRRNLPYVYGKLQPPENVSRLIAICWYSRRAREAVLSLKYGGLVYPADALAHMMSKKLLRDGTMADKTNKADVLAPVPSGFLSMRKRFFPVAKTICKRMSLRLDIPMDNVVGASDGKTEQKTLSEKSRRENAMKSFFVKENANIIGKRVMLIDDVCTTGSTISAIAGKLLEAGAADVSACVFAKTIQCTHTDSGVLRLRIGNRCGGASPLKFPILH